MVELFELVAPVVDGLALLLLLLPGEEELLLLLLLLLVLLAGSRVIWSLSAIIYNNISFLALFFFIKAFIVQTFF